MDPGGEHEASRMGRTLLKAALVAAGLALAVWALFFAGGGQADRLTVSFWGAFEEWAMWKRIAAAFQEAHPDIPVKLEYWPGAHYADKVRVVLASGRPPDVILFQDEPFAPFCEFGKFEDLTPYLAREGGALDLDRDYWATAVSSFQWKGRTYGLPIWGGNNLIYVNLDLFDALGVAPPAPDWTLEDFVATCQALTRDTDGDGRVDHYGFSPPYWLYWLPFLYAHGTTFVEADGRFPVAHEDARWAFTGPKAVAAWQFLQDLIWKHEVVPDSGEMGQVGGNVLFLTGRVGMFTSGPWEMPFLNRTDLDWDVVHVPRGPGGRGTRVTWDALVMAADSRRKSAAWQFMRFCVGPTAQAIVAETQRSVPALKAAQETFIEVAPNPDVHVERFIEAMDYARVQPITDHWDKMGREVNLAFSRLTLEQQDDLARAVRELAEKQRPLFGGGEGGP